MNLYLKYRPQTFAEIIGNEETVSVLQNMINSQECPHVFLLHGQTGCGKTTLARIMAKELGCKGNDLAEIDSADFRGIDTVREIKRLIQYKPLESSCRVWVIDECHKMTNDAQNAFLKILEDTPSHVYFILCTTEPQKLLPTIKGRCNQLQVKPLSDAQMGFLLRKISRAEEQKLEQEVRDQIIQDSLGLPRNALQILDQVLRVPAEQRLTIAQKTAEQQSQSIELCRALISKKSWKEVTQILNGLKEQDPESIRRHILGYSQAVLLKEKSDRAALTIECFFEPLYNIGFPGLVFACYSVVNN